MSSNFTPKLVLGCTLSLVGIGGFAVASDSEIQCRGSEQAQCEALDHCTWVNAYERRDGVQVAGHCRNRGGRRREAPSPSPAPEAPNLGDEQPASE